MNFKLPLSMLLALILLGGCSSAQKGNVPVPDARTLSGESREWWDIYSVEFTGDRKVRSKVGYFYRKFNAENPKGYYWVKDLGLNENPLGFILPDSNKAYLILHGANGKLESQDLGIADRDLGIKRILQIPLTTTIELEKVQIARPAAGILPAAASSK